MVGLSPGRATVTATCNFPAATPLSVSITVDVTEFANGAYYLYNETSDGDGVLALENDMFVLSDFDGTENQSWALCCEGNNYYSIQTNFLYLAYSPDLGLYATHGTGVTDAKLWTIEKCSSGNYKIVSKLDNSKAVSTINNLSIETLNYANDEVYTDEWKIIGNVDVSFVASEEGGSGRTTYFDEMKSYMLEYGYSNIYHNAIRESYGMTTNECLARMATSKIFLIRSHGTPTSIKTTNSDQTLDAPGWIEYTYLNTINQSTPNIFSYADLVICGVCLGGEGGVLADNMVNVIYEGGAKTVIGFEKSINTAATTEYFRLFFKHLKSGTATNYNSLCNNVINELMGYDQFAQYITYVKSDGTEVDLTSHIVAGCIETVSP